MTRQEFHDSLESTFKECLALSDKKNADYATGSNPFANFENAKIAHVSVEQAIIIRLTDKLTRVSNLLHRDAEVTDETIEDTIKDGVNYFAILRAYIQSKG